MPHVQTGTVFAETKKLLYALYMDTQDIYRYDTLVDGAGTATSLTNWAASYPTYTARSIAASGSHVVLAGVVSGAPNHYFIAHSPDRGVTWEIPVYNDFYFFAWRSPGSSVKFDLINPLLGWTVASYAGGTIYDYITVYVTQDGGHTWAYIDLTTIGMHKTAAYYPYIVDLMVAPAHDGANCYVLIPIVFAVDPLNPPPAGNIGVDNVIYKTNIDGSSVSFIVVTQLDYGHPYSGELDPLVQMEVDPRDTDALWTLPNYQDLTGLVLIYYSLASTSVTGEPTRVAGDWWGQLVISKPGSKFLITSNWLTSTYGVWVNLWGQPFIFYDVTGIVGSGYPWFGGAAKNGGVVAFPMDSGAALFTRDEATWGVTGIIALADLVYSAAMG